LKAKVLEVQPIRIWQKKGNRNNMNRLYVK